MAIPAKPSKTNQHSGFFKSGFSSEFIQETQKPDTHPQKKIIIHKIGGILSLGRTIEIGQSPNQPEKNGNYLSKPANHLEKERTVLMDSRQKELRKNIEALRTEIKKLAESTKNLDKQIEKAVLETTSEPSQYQVSFLERVRVFIINFRKNITEAAIWMEVFATKKKKRNTFWGRVKNKKGGGQQYLFSGEHSASRSAA